jgi:hypothetical protein
MELLMRTRNAGLLALALLTTACSWRDTSFTLVFRDAAGLKPGQFLVLQGVRVGEVGGVNLAGGQAQVEARVYRKYRETVCAESSFLIEKPGGLLDMSGEKQVSIAARFGSACTPILDRAIIQGDNSLLGAIAESARQLASAAWTKVGELAQTVATEFEKTQGGREIADQIRAFGQNGTGGPSAVAELEALGKRAEALRDRLKGEGRAAEAEELWQHFNSWYAETRKLLDTEVTSGSQRK